MTEKDAGTLSLTLMTFSVKASWYLKWDHLPVWPKCCPVWATHWIPARIKEVEARIRTSEAMIQSMTKKERADPDLLIKDKTARSRLLPNYQRSRCPIRRGTRFVGEFQKMRTMMSRMQKQMGGGGGAGGMMPGDPALASPGAMAEQVAAGNRQARRSAKKKVKAGRGGGGGFGR
jgi:signal recognition particle subunit SRP54